MKYFLIVFVFIIFGCGNAKLSDYFGDGAISFSSNSKISANTNMQWQDNQRAKKYMNIRQAYRYCNTLSLDGYNDWFLPTFYEYENNDISFNNKLNNVWTSTSDESGDYSYFNGIKKSNNDRAYTRCARNIKSNLSKYSKPILKYKDVSTNTDYESLDFNIVYDSYKSVKIKSIYVYMKLGYKTITKNVAINKIASSHGQKYISLDTKDIINRDGRYSVVVSLKTTNYQTFDYRLYFNVSLTNKPPVARFRHKKNKNSISFFNTSFDDGDICTYKWNFDDGTTSRAKNPTHSFKESRYYNVSLIVKDCKGRYSKKFSKNIYIKVNKPPKASFDFIIKDTYYFKGIEVYNTSYDDKGICNYKWLINSKPVSFDAQPSFKFSENSSGYIELIVTDCEGLSDSDRQSYRLDVFKKK